MRFAVAHGEIDHDIMQPHMWDGRTYEARELVQEDDMRQTWGDRLPRLLRSRIFQQAPADPGEPLFWVPMIALLAGLRSEETLQLHTTT